MKNVELIELVDEGSTVITVNQRLSRYLSEEYHKQQKASGKQVWSTPDILPLTSWLKRCYFQTLGNFGEKKNKEQKLFLNSSQESMIWENIIRNSEYGDVLLQVPEAAQKAASAWQLLHEWDLTLNGSKSHKNKNISAFANWSEKFKETCDSNNWIDNTRLINEVIHQIEIDGIKLPNKLILVGFDQLTRLEQKLLDKIKEHGSKVDIHQSQKAKKTPDALVLKSSNRNDEIVNSALWAKQLLEQNQDISIGIIVPRLEDYRSAIFRIFDDIFIPKSEFSDSRFRDRPYNMSLGKSLSDYPVVKTALLILDFLIKGQHSLSHIGTILRSPFICGGQAEETKRANLDFELREIGELLISIIGLMSNAEKIEGDFKPEILIDILKKSMQLLNTISKNTYPSLWAETYSNLLFTIGWPGDRSLSSHEYQAVQKWNEILFEFAQLDDVTEEISKFDAFEKLKKISNDTIFQSESEHKPIQVLGLLEAVGIEFNHLWIMGLDSDTFPAKPHPNPFLPREIQIKNNVPHSTYNWEIEFAERTLKQLLNQSQHVVLSYAEREEDLELQPSTLIRSFNNINMEELNLPNFIPYSFESKRSIEFEEFQDCQGPELREKEVVSGGTSIFKNQAACPFRAFARHRLVVAELNEGHTGLNNLERGDLVHRVLKEFWGEVIKYENFISKTPDEIKSILSRLCKKQLEVLAKKKPSSITTRFKQIEYERLVNLLFEWLELEKSRKPFEVITREAKRNYSFEGLDLNMIIDRIDRLEDGSLVVLDYKTGMSSINSWFGERPDEPQMLLYLILYSETPAGIIFGQVKRGDCRFKGVTKEENLIPEVSSFTDNQIKYYLDIDGYENIDSWNDMIVYWTKNLKDLALEFQSGKADVSPKNTNTCRNCGLEALCRIKDWRELNYKLDYVEE